MTAPYANHCQLVPFDRIIIYGNIKIIWEENLEIT